MKQNEAFWDKLLKIRTSGRDDSMADQYRYPYEPTPYCVIERLANSGEIRKSKVLLDYGCGKGRVVFYNEIDCSDLFPGENPREKIIIFHLNPV